MSAGIIGVDLSLRRTGMASHFGVWAIEVPARGTHAERIRAMSDRVVADIPPGSRVVTEGQYATRNNAAVLLGLWWHVMVELDRGGVTVLVATNTQVRTFATGSGNVARRGGEGKSARRRRGLAELVDAVSARTGVVYPADDEAVADVLRCMGAELLGRQHPMSGLPQSHRRAIDGLEWPR